MLPRRRPPPPPRGRLALAAAVVAAVALEAHGDATTTTTNTTTSGAPVRCAALRGNCEQCIDAGCNFCEVSSVVQRHPKTLTDEQIAAQEEALDYACLAGSCATLTMTRPGTQHFKFLFRYQCPSDVHIGPTVTTTSTATPGPDADVSNFLGITKTQVEEGPDEWPQTWGPMHWAAVLGPPLFLISLACGFYWKCRLREKAMRRVRPDAVASTDTLGKNGQDLAALNFSAAGPLTPERISELDAVLSESMFAAKQKGLNPPRPCIAFTSANALARPHLLNLLNLVDKHPSISIRLDTDWRGAADRDLQALGILLSRRDRCHLAATSGQARGAPGRLRLPLHAAAPALGDLAEVLATAGHATIDTVWMEALAGRPGEGGATVSLDLTPLRLSCQDLALNRLKIGDVGCAVACGFVRPWAGRLVAIRLLECNIGDDGACELARLIAGRRQVARDPSAAAAASGLRELVLSANRIGDRGASQIAEALPKCDVLERLLLDRNLIGTPGARALGRNLKRSNIRELVLGSHLGGNPLGPLGAEALAGAMSDGLDRAAANRGHRLQALNLEGCEIGEPGAAALASALPSSSIMLLSLARDAIGNAGAAAILQAVPPGIRSLDLSGNALSDRIADAAGDTLHKCPTLGLSLAQNDLSSMMISVLREAHGQRLRV